MEREHRSQRALIEATLNRMPIAEAAAFYTANGWPIFPLHGKIPYKDTSGHRDATTYREQIAEWWTAHPGANIGLPTGAKSGLIVLDMDVPDGYYHLKQLIAAYEVLPETRTVSTANGGTHYYFLHPREGNEYHGTVGLQNLAGLDARADGNYVVLPPSKLYGRKAYRWNNPKTPIAQIPDWLLSLLPKKSEQHHHYPHDLRFAYPSGEQWLANAVARATEGNRNAVGFWLACQLRDDGLSAEQATGVILAYANSVPEGQSPYTSQEAVRSVRSAYRRPPRERARKIYP